MIDHSQAHVLLTHLISVGVLTNPSSVRPWPGFLSMIPNSPVNVVTVYDTAGIGDGRIMETGETKEHPGFQLRIRANTYLVGVKKGMALNRALDAILRNEVTIEGKTYLLQAVRRTTPILPIGEEEGGGRLLFTINGTLTYSFKTP